MKRTFVPALLAGSLAAISGMAEAHFFQPVGDKTVGFFVGFILEPGYEGEPNGIEIFAKADVRYDANGNPARFRTINPTKHPEDSVRLEATVQVLESADPQAKVLAEKKVGKLRLAQPSLGRYTVDFTPYPAGIYAFKMSGRINGQRFNGRMICSVGSHETFTCIQPAKPRAPEVFPQE
ncbi:MAG: hypothetical protein U1E83_08755 [Methylotetracoccus sp.]